MNWLNVTKDGGPLSKVWAYWLVELKRAFSVLLLRFDDGSREAYHSHAFDSIGWVLKGRLVEEVYGGQTVTRTPSWKPFLVARTTCHKVTSEGRSWVINLRGPWLDKWAEVDEKGERHLLTHGRYRV